MGSHVLQLRLGPSHNIGLVNKFEYIWIYKPHHTRSHLSPLMVLMVIVCTPMHSWPLHDFVTNINSKEADANQHYIYIPVMNINYRYMSTCIIGGIKNTILPWRKWMLTNKVNKNDQTFKLSTINPQEHTNITQHSHLLVGSNPWSARAPRTYPLVSSS